MIIGISPFFSHFLGGFVVSKTKKIGLSKSAFAGPFREFDLRDELWLCRIFTETITIGVQLS
jgi:hypothetical protein